MDSSRKIWKLDVHHIFQFTQNERLHEDLDHVEQLSVWILCSSNTLRTRWLDHGWCMQPRTSPSMAFFHCFGFQYVPSVFQLLGILATFFGGIGWCFHWKLGKSCRGFSGLSQATPAWKGRASDGKCGLRNAKGKQTEEGALRCKSGSAEGNLWGNYTETLMKRLWGWRWIPIRLLEK